MKLGNVYNLDSVKAFLDSHKRHGFTDSYSGASLARNLTAVDPKIFEKKFPELAFVNCGIEADNSGGYAARIQSLRLQSRGGFRIAGDESSTKGKISLSGEDSYIKVFEKEADSTWTDTEIKQAELSNINLVSRYLQSHNEIYLREVDEAGFIGIVGNKGLLNNSVFVTGTATGAATGLTSQQLYDDISGQLNDQFDGVKNTPEYMANVYVMPVTVFNIIRAKMLNTANGSSTVLKALQDNFPGVTFTSSVRCESVGGNKVTAAFSTNSESMKMRLPLPLTIGQIINVGSFDYKVDSKYRIAGLDILESTAGNLMTGF